MAALGECSNLGWNCRKLFFDRFADLFGPAIYSEALSGTSFHELDKVENLFITPFSVHPADSSPEGTRLWSN
ncbi:unnamed protein product [Anisakis simplex]|uniref:Uncharacterized protein n=1 Tax=Anisakis simplex TaxID=6269 RepID=A0A0M3KD94_ANISI|nr:unnamed protein product [Anisakis simplex]